MAGDPSQVHKHHSFLTAEKMAEANRDTCARLAKIVVVRLRVGESVRALRAHFADWLSLETGVYTYLDPEYPWGRMPREHPVSGVHSILDCAEVLRLAAVHMIENPLMPHEASGLTPEELAADTHRRLAWLTATAAGHAMVAATSRGSCCNSPRVRALSMAAAIHCLDEAAAVHRAMYTSEDRSVATPVVPAPQSGRPRRHIPTLAERISTYAMIGATTR